MGEFFKGWRQKLGLLTLLMACVAMGGWVRSFSVMDEIVTRIDDQNIYHFRSTDSKVSWCRVREQHPFQESFLKTYFSTPSQVNHFFRERDDIQWRWQCLGFEFGRLIQNGSQMELEIWSVPYWPIAVSLTLISLWLVLAKPHKSTSDKTTETIAEKAGVNHA